MGAADSALLSYKPDKLNPTQLPLSPPHLLTNVSTPSSHHNRYVAADELIEVTPTKLRLRKRTLDSGLRRQHKRNQ